MRDYTEVTDAIRKLEESRHVLNKLMGPGGALSDSQRKTLLGNNYEEHDRLVQSLEAQGNSASRASGSFLLKNNPSKAYFNNNGIAGGYAGNAQSHGLQDQFSAMGSGVAGGNSAILVNDNNEDDDFWYQSPGGN